MTVEEHLYSVCQSVSLFALAIQNIWLSWLSWRSAKVWLFLQWNGTYS